MIKKINLYVFIQIIKSCTLVFFIFVSIAWLLQISRLFSYLSNLQIRFIEIFNLSIFLIPNLINTILPFIVIFGLIITFIKLEKDREIIAIYSLGLSIDTIKKPIIYFGVIIGITYLLLNFFLSPFIYDIYKKKEFEIRNLIDLNNINISNFIQIDKNLILDFKKENNDFINVFIKYNDLNDNKELDSENIIYSKKAIIEKSNDYLLFNLINGFKLNFNNNKIEKLEFTNYKLKFLIKKNIQYNNIDKNSLTLLKLIKDKNNTIILEKIYDILIVIALIVFFYFNSIKSHNYHLKNIIIYIILSTIILIIQNLIKTIGINDFITVILYNINLLIIVSFILFQTVKKK